MKLQSPLFILGAVFAGLQIAGAATIYQIDFERSDGTAINPIVTQAGWTSMAATNAGPATNHVMSTTGLTMTAGGTLGYFAGRGTTATWGLVTGTSWDDMQDDCISARSGDGTVTLAFSGLDDLLTYTFTAWHNVSATDSASFAAGFYTITPSVTGGSLVGAADSGKASQITKLTPSVTDASFDTTVISFMPNGGNAAITLTSASTSQFLVMSGMSLESVPEPAAALLSGLGLLALLRRRRA